MASALRGRTRCLVKCMTFSCKSGVQQPVRRAEVAHRIGCWIALSSGYHTSVTWQRNKWVQTGSSSRLFIDSTAMQMPPLSFRHSHRHNSTVSGILHKIFILNAESPVPNEDIVNPAAVHVQLDTAIVDTVSQDPPPLVLDAVPDASGLQSDSGELGIHLTQEVSEVSFSDAADFPSVPDATSIPLVQSSASIPSTPSDTAVPLVPDDDATSLILEDATNPLVLEDATNPLVLEDAAILSVPEDVDIPSISDAATISSVPDGDAVYSVSDAGATHFPDFAAEGLSASQTSIESIAYIPPPPAPPEAVGPALNALGEPTFQSIGLGGWSPVGIIQNCLEHLHVTADLPWWAAICLATVALRTLIFPLVILAQKNAAKMNNHLPQLQILQMKMTEARNCGDQLNAARYGQEMVGFMKEKDISPLKNVIVPLAQAPIFISMFMALRRLANLPVESFKDGGLFWFSDLTVCDPYYLLPVITSVTMYATIELGTDGARLSSQNMQAMKWVLRAMPFVIFPFTVNFPAAVLCYWVSTNLFSLIQVGFLRIPSIRKYFKIDALITHKPETLPQKKKGVVDSFKDSWKNMQISKEIEERERYDEMRFKKSGAGPIVRTYKHDPTKRVINVQAKMKSK